MGGGPPTEAPTASNALENDESPGTNSSAWKQRDPPQNTAPAPRLRAPPTGRPDPAPFCQPTVDSLPRQTPVAAGLEETDPPDSDIEMDPNSKHVSPSTSPDSTAQCTPENMGHPDPKMIPRAGKGRAMMVPKLTAPSIEGYFNEFWKEQAWDFQWMAGSHWEKLPSGPPEVAHGDRSAVSSAGAAALAPLEAADSSGQANGDNAASSEAPPVFTPTDLRFPPLRRLEVELARPHPNAYFSPKTWSWHVVTPYSNSNPSTLSAECRTVDQQGLHIGFDQGSGAVQGHHIFVHISRVVDPHWVPQLRIQPTSPWTDDGLWYPGADSLIALDPNQPCVGKEDWWDLWVCGACGEAVTVSACGRECVDQERGIVSGVFNRRDVEVLIREKEASPLPGQTPKQALYRAFHTFYLVLVNGLLNNRRDVIPVDGKTFSARLPWEPLSAKLWGALGCRLRDTNEGRPSLCPPTLSVRTSEGRAMRARWVRAMLELGIFLTALDPTAKDGKTSNALPQLELSDATQAVLRTLGGGRVPRSISRHFGSAPVPAALRSHYAMLGITPDLAEPAVYAAYKAQSILHPDETTTFFDALVACADASSDQSDLRVFVVQERSMGMHTMKEYEGALTVMKRKDTDPLTTDESIMERFGKLSEEFPELIPEYRNALAVIADVRKSDLLRSVLMSTDTSGKTMSYDDALNSLGVAESTPDDVLLATYSIAIEERPTHKDVLWNALSVIGETRKSQVIGEFLNHPYDPSNMQMILAPNRASKDLPAGLCNIGNTCYLNSLLQYFFSVKPLREVILSFQEYEETEHSGERGSPKRVGGRVVTRREIERSKHFCVLLQSLFDSMIRTNESAVTPERELAYLALVSSRDDEQLPARKTSSNSTDATLVDEETFGRAPPALPSPKGQSPTPPAPEAASPSSVLGKRKSDNGETPESAMDLDSHPSNRPFNEGRRLDHHNFEESVADELLLKLEPGNPSANEQLQPQRSATLPAAASARSASFTSRQRSNTFASTVPLPSSPNLTTLEELRPRSSYPQQPPALPPRPKPPLVATDANAMMFGRQNDVSECMDNCLFQIQTALDEEKLEAKHGQGNLIKSLFYGSTRQALTFADAGSKVSVKEEPFAYLLVDVAEEGRDLYDGLDTVFDESVVEVEGGKAVRRVVLRDLPPILQIQLQRVQFDRSTHTVYKSNAYMKFDDRLMMDRYLQPDEKDSDAVLRYEDTLSHRKEMERLRERAATLSSSIPGDKQSAHATLQKMHSVLATQGAPHAELLENLLTINDVNFLEEEASALEAEAKEVEANLAKLKSQVSALWETAGVPEAEYRLVSLFIHRGVATGGHYWAVQRNLPHRPEQWLSYNDEVIRTDVDDSQIFCDTKGDSANPYWLTYVRKDLEAQMFDMVRRDLRD